ncbi:DUF4189 domain-containing protein [Mycolicibacterium sp.]|uniref:DUF4189 domain-containing protein n=1 Tax=Mycolicibacterium sp. TaxID=2320850 RepID=UPI0037CA8562
MARWRFGGGAALAATIAALTVVPAHAEDTWVAIYYSRPEFAYGYATNAPTREAAEAEARDKCVYNGGTDCTWVAVKRNGCAALAWAPDGSWAGGYGATITDAEQDAIASNKGLGSIFISKCSS